MKKVQPPTTIIISHVYSSDNKGDAALTSVLIKELRQRFPAARLRILKLEMPKDNSRFEGVPEQPAFMCHALYTYKHPFLKLLYTLYMISATLGWALWFRLTGWQIYLPRKLRAIALTYVEADLIVAVGGGYIRSRRGWAHCFNIPLLLHPLLFSYLIRKPTVLYSQSVGPFVHRYERLLVAWVLQRMTLIMLREDTSFKLLAELGVRQNSVRSIDAGFLLQSSQRINIRQRYAIPQDKLIIGVTVRSWLAGDAQKSYEQGVAGTLDKAIQHNNAYILFIPQVTAAKGDDDRITSRHVYNLMKQTASATIIEDTPDHFQIKALYDGLDLLIGTRFHSVIFSLTSFVPVLAIEYEHKTSGIMHDLHLDAWVIKIEDVTEHALTTLLHTLLSGYDTYRANLAEHVPPYVLHAQQAGLLLEEAYYESKA